MVGENTHHHDQSMTSVNLSTIKTIVKVDNSLIALLHRCLAYRKHVERWIVLRKQALYS
jgi:hypothetical protein